MAQEFTPLSHPTAEKVPPENQEEFDRQQPQTPVEATNRISEKSATAKSPLRPNNSSAAGEELGLLSAITGVALLQDKEFLEKVSTENIAAENFPETEGEGLSSQQDGTNFEEQLDIAEGLLPPEPSSLQNAAGRTTANDTEIENPDFSLSDPNQGLLEAASDNTQDIQNIDPAITVEQGYLGNNTEIVTEQITGGVAALSNPTFLANDITAGAESVGTENGDVEDTVDRLAVDLVDSPLDASDEAIGQFIDQSDTVAEETAGIENSPVVTGDTSEDTNAIGSAPEDLGDGVGDVTDIVDNVSSGVINDLADYESPAGGVVDEIIGSENDGDNIVNDLTDNIPPDSDVIDELIGSTVDDDGVVDEVMSGVINDLVDEALPDSSIVDDLVDDVIGDGGIVDDLVGDVIDDGGFVNELISGVVNDNDIVDDLVGDVIDDDGFTNELISGVVDDNDVVDDLVGDVIDSTVLIDDTFNDDEAVNDLIDSVLDDSSVVDNLVDSSVDDGDSLIPDVLGSFTGGGEDISSLDNSVTSDSSGNGLIGDLLGVVSSGDDGSAPTDPIEDSVEPVTSGLMGDLVGSLIGNESPATINDNTPVIQDDASPVDGLLNDIDNSLFS